MSAAVSGTGAYSWELYIRAKFASGQPIDRLVSGTAYVVDLGGSNRLTSRTDRLGRRRDFSYDDANRLTAEAWISGGSTVQNLTFTYDANSNILTARDNDGTHTFTYDGLNRPTVVNSMFGLTLTNTFDAVGNRTKREDNFGGILTSTYDAADRLTKREFGGSGQTPLRIDLTYTNRDQVETITRYSDLAGTNKIGSSTYTYDAPGRLSNLSHRNGSSTLLANYTYTYDLASRLTSEVLNGTTTNFGYDATDQLTSDGTTNYTFDLNGNRTMTGYQTGTGNRLTNDGTWTYTYDAEGNLTKKSKGPSLETWDYAYDNINHLTSVTKRASDGGTVQMQATYTYDVFGNRIQTEVDSDGAGAGASVISRFGFDFASLSPSGRGIEGEGLAFSSLSPAGRGIEGEGLTGLPDVWVDLNSSNQLQMRRLYLDAVDSVYARINSSGTAAWYLPDRLGSIRDLVDASGAVQDHIDYSGFGVITNETNATFGDRYKWTGREYDSESGLQYNRARYYDAAVGRWLNEDPIGFAAGDSNLSRYVGNSANNLTDPSGFISVSHQAAQPPKMNVREAYAKEIMDMMIGQMFNNITLGDKLGYDPKTTPHYKKMTELYAKYRDEVIGPLSDREREHIERLIKQLADDEFEKREEAQKRLREDYAHRALKLLEDASNQKNQDPEIRKRAKEVIDETTERYKETFQGKLSEDLKRRDKVAAEKLKEHFKTRQEALPPQYRVPEDRANRK